MKKITKDNLKSFLEYYHDFHDSTISNINYNIEKSEIDLLINVYWSGTPVLKEDKTYKTNKRKLKMIFNGVELVITKEIFTWDYITKANIEYTTLENKEYISFKDDLNEPQIYILSDSIEYEELSD